MLKFFKSLSFFSQRFFCFRNCFYICIVNQTLIKNKDIMQEKKKSEKSENVEQYIPKGPGTKVEESGNAVTKFFKKGLQIDSSTSWHNVPLAQDSYLKTTYGKQTSKTELVKDVVERINKKIEYSTSPNVRKYWCIETVDSEIMEYADEIAEAYRKYGYKVWILSRNSLEKLVPEQKIDNSMMWILVTWDKVF